MKQLIKDVATVGICGGVFAAVISLLRLIKNMADGLKVTIRDIIYLFLDGIYGIIFCAAAYLIVSYWEPTKDPEKLKMIELLCCGFFAGANNSLRQIIYKIWLNILTRPKQFIADCREIIGK